MLAAEEQWQVRQSPQTQPAHSSPHLEDHSTALDFQVLGIDAVQLRLSLQPVFLKKSLQQGEAAEEHLNPGRKDKRALRKPWLT